VVVRNAALRRELFRSPRGEVAQDLTTRAVRVANTAAVLCPVDNGPLRASITWTDPVPVAEGLLVQVGSNLRYSLPVHEGSGSEHAPFSWKVAHARGHVIPPRRFLVNALPAGR
jgi:hypothetical protein